MAALEGGRSALAAATGQAAEVTAILTLCSAGDHIVSASTLYGGTHTLLHVNLKKLGIETTFVDPADPREFQAGVAQEHEAPLRRNPRQSAHQHRRHRSPGRHRTRSRHSARPRQHRAFAVSVPADGMGRGRRGALRDQVHRRPRHHHGRRDRRVGQVQLGQRQVPGIHLALAGLSRRHLPRDLRRFRLHHEGAHGDHAHLRPGARADQRLAPAARARVAAPAHGAPLREHAGGRPVPPGASARGVGELSRIARQPLPRACAGSTCRRAPRACSISA